MRWLNPWAFMGLFAVALPVLVHLLSRRQARTMAFPSLRFLAPSRLLPTRRTRLSDVPLLVVRSAIVALAALALAQPRWSPRDRAATTRSTRARAIIVQTDPYAAGQADSARRGELEGELTALEGASDTHLRIPIAEPHGALAGAVDWLRTQSSLGEIVVVSDFADDALDASDIATVPAHIGLSFKRLPANVFSGAPTTARGRVIWLTDAPALASDGVLRSVRQVAGPEAVNVQLVSAQSSYADTIGAALSDSLPTVLITSSAIDLASFPTAASAVSASWIGPAIVELARDSAVASSAATTTGLNQSGFEADYTVLARDANGVALSAARVVRIGDRRPLLVVVSHAPATHLHAAALLLAASRLVALPTAKAGLKAGTNAVVAPADSEVRFAQRDRQLQAWQRAPSVPTVASGDAQRDTPGSDAANAGADEGVSHGWMAWLVVLALLAVEWGMRRRTAAVPAPA